MSNLRYLELSSNYRNRNQWPEPGEFEIPISQSGRKGATDAIDPVCLSTPFIFWKINQFNVIPNPTINLVVENTPIVNSTEGKLTIYVKGANKTEVLHPKNDYYYNAMLFNTSTGCRINSYTYLERNRARIVVEGGFFPGLTASDALTITDPTDFSDVSSPYIYIPGPRLQQNVLVNKYIYNETLDEYRPLGVYDAATSIVPIITTGSVTSNRSSGPIFGWGYDDNVSLRVKPPLSILSEIAGVPARIELTQPQNLDPKLRHYVFNFDKTTPHSSIEGSFLQRLPYYSATANQFGGIPGTYTNATTFTLDPVDISVHPDGYWVGSTIYIVDSGQAVPNRVDSQERLIVEYISGVGQIIVDPAFSGDIIVGGIGNATYTLYTPEISRRIQKYVKYQDAIPLGTATSVDSFQFPLVGSSNEENFYKDLIIKITSGPANGDFSSIKSYTVTNKTKTIVLNTPLSAVPNPGDAFSITSGKTDPFPFTLTSFPQTFVILPFSYDNLNPFVFTGSLISQQELVCYEVQLLNLILPNVILGTASGSLISFYPYVYVELQNVTAAGAGLNNIIYSNNPNATRALFRCPIKDIPNPTNSTFIKIDGSGMVQTIKFRPNDTLFFGVYLPNGEIFTTILDETMSPLLPNPTIQISACFSIKRLS